MKLYDVYPLFDVEPVSAKDCYVYDQDQQPYLDFYGGHAVISIGHSHPHYVKRLNHQLSQIAFYSNSVGNQLQKDLAEKLGQLSGYEDYHLFLCNSGAEANENALKLASFHNGKNQAVAFRHSFHGRTSGALAITDNPSLQAPINRDGTAHFLEMGDSEGLEKLLKTDQIVAVIIEGIQGIGGINVPSESFLQDVEALCKKYQAAFILDEIQSGYGRTGEFFAHQQAQVRPDLITVAKGMGNGFPVGGVLIHPKYQAKYGQLGTTFGGNHLACAAALAVLEVMEREELVENAKNMGAYLISKLQGQAGIQEIKGKGLMLGLKFDYPIKELRLKLLIQAKVFTGSAKDPNMLRLLPPLTIGKTEADLFVKKLINVTQKLESDATVSVD